MGEGYSKAHWAKDETAKTCRVCAAEFSFSRRRHHCRNCGYIFCEDCSFRTQPVPNRNITAPVRVCDDCYFALLDSGRAPAISKSESRLVERRAPSTQQAQTQQSQSQQPPTPVSSTGPSAGEKSGSAQSQPAAPTTPPSEQLQQPTAQPAAVVPTVKRHEQRLQERLAVVMQQVRQESVYLESDAVVVEGPTLDEEPQWADEPNYVALEYTTADRHIIPFPQGQTQDDASQLLLGDVARKPDTAVDTSLIWSDDAKKRLMSMIAPYALVSNTEALN